MPSNGVINRLPCPRLPFVLADLYQSPLWFARRGQAVPRAAEPGKKVPISLRQTALDSAFAPVLVGYGGLCYLPHAARATDNESCPRTVRCGRRSRSKSGKRRVPASTTASGVASRYANALFDLAKERGGLDEAGADLAALQQAVGESDDLARLLRSPIISRDEHARATAALAERIGASATVKNFLGVLANQRRLGALPAIIDEFARLLAAHRGEETAEVTSAQPLDESQLGSVRDAVATYAGRPVQLTASVDPSLLGGIVVRIGSRMIDASLKTKLHNLELSMRGIR